MMEIYALINKHDKKNFCRTLIGIDGYEMFNVIIEKILIDNRIHRKLKKSFKYCDLVDYENPKKALFERGVIYSDHKSIKNEFSLLKLPNHFGEYLPRIYRPYLEISEIILINNNHKVEKLEKVVFNYPDYNPNSIDLVVSSLNQLVILADMLSDILKTVYPCQKNLKTFGHDIKNLLVLSCIEVEAQLKGIFKANELSSKVNYSTKDYIKLKDIMQLQNYTVRLPLYPNLKKFTPFKDWNNTIGPTKSLKWYDNYNSVKHNSETDFSKATLDTAINSICAIAILLQAQYGSDIPFWREELGNYFEITNNCLWKLSDGLLPPLNGNDWQLKKIGL